MDIDEVDDLLIELLTPNDDEAKESRDKILAAFSARDEQIRRFREACNLALERLTVFKECGYAADYQIEKLRTALADTEPQ